jgi:HPt (histidine-containing phosphotransfer) domain-containing protein
MSLGMLSPRPGYSIVFPVFRTQTRSSYSHAFLSIVSILRRSLPEGRQRWKAGSVFLKSEHFDPESLWRRLDHDRGLLREVVAVFAVEAPQLLARIEEGIRGSSAGEVKRASHKLKGSLLQFSARTAVAAAQELEEKAQNGVVAGAAPLLNRLRHEIDLLREGLNAMVCGPSPAHEPGKNSRRGTISRE